MVNGILGFLGAANPIISLAQDAVGLVENANDASNPNNSSESKRNARKGFINNAVNIGVPVGAAVIGGVASTNGVGAIPAGLAAQNLVKSSGIGNLAGEVLQPILKPFAGIASFFKKKVKKHLGLDLSDIISMGLNLIKPMLNMGESVSSRSSNLKPSMKPSAPTKNPLENILGMLGVFGGNKTQNGNSGLGGIINMVTGLLGEIGKLFGNKDDKRSKPIIHSANTKMAQAGASTVHTALNTLTSTVTKRFK